MQAINNWQMTINSWQFSFDSWQWTIYNGQLAICNEQCRRLTVENGQFAICNERFTAFVRKEHCFRTVKRTVLLSKKDCFTTQNRLFYFICAWLSPHQSHAVTGKEHGFAHKGLHFPSWDGDLFFLVGAVKNKWKILAFCMFSVILRW